MYKVFVAKIIKDEGNQILTREYLVESGYDSIEEAMEGCKKVLFEEEEEMPQKMYLVVRNDFNVIHAIGFWPCREEFVLLNYFNNKLDYYTPA